MKDQTDLRTPDIFGEDLPATAADRLSDQPERWPAQLAELTDLHYYELRAALPELAEAPAWRVAVRLVTRFVREYGGSRPYIPKDDSIVRALRDLEIWAEHDGTVESIRAIAKRYRLSDNAVWEILRAQRKLHRRRVQPDLFEGLDAGPGKRA